jgi:hypothetical protein
MLANTSSFHFPQPSRAVTFHRPRRERGIMADQQHVAHCLFLHFPGSQQSSASAEFGDIASKSSTDGSDVPCETDRDVAQRPTRQQAQGRHPRHAIAQGDNILGNLVLVSRPRIEQRLVGSAKQI